MLLYTKLYRCFCSPVTAGKRQSDACSHALPLAHPFPKMSGEMAASKALVASILVFDRIMQYMFSIQTYPRQSISALTYTFKSYTRALKVWRPCQQQTNPCNFLIWMHVELLPNRTRSGDRRQGMPRGSCQRQFVSSFGLFSWQVAPVAHSCSCCATTWVSACSLSSQARPIGRCCLAFPELECSCILTWISPPMPEGPDRPDVPTHRTKREAFAARKASPVACWRRLRAGAATPSAQAPNAQVSHVAPILSAVWAPFLSVQQYWPRTCSPRTREAFSMVSHCGQSAKLAGNTLHQNPGLWRQDCSARPGSYFPL